MPDQGSDNNKGVTIKKPTDLMDEDESKHARVDDPVCPPARMPKEYDATGTPVSSSTGSGDSILSRLFDPDRKQKPALWSVRLFVMSLLKSFLFRCHV